MNSRIVRSDDVVGVLWVALRKWTKDMPIPKVTYYTDLFSPETYEKFTSSPQNVSGFRLSQLSMAQKVEPGDRFICYMTKLSRWVGVLQVESPFFQDSAPLFYQEDDPFVVRFNVNPIAWLPKDKTVPIHEPICWKHLSFTRGLSTHEMSWTGMLRRSLNRMEPQDGKYLETLLKQQSRAGTTFPVDEKEFRKLVSQRIKLLGRTVTVTVPADPTPPEIVGQQEIIRESSRIQALIASIGEKMGYKVWLPRNDRSRVLQEWKAQPGSLLEELPLSYNETTNQTIEQIDVLWLKGRTIYRAFEVEHTTAVYSGILRMADLLALQPMIKIKLHIVAPESRREKVFSEIRRPVFSVLESGPLSECCTFLSYDSLQEIFKNPHLKHLSDSVLEEYAQEAE